MVTALQSAAKTTANAPLTSFADMVNYEDMFNGLQSKGYALTEEQRNASKKILGDELRNLDGGQVIGNSLGAVVQTIGYTLFACLQNLWSGNFSGIGDVLSNFGSTLTNTSDQSKLWQLQQDASHASLRLVQAGIPTGAAELMTGVKPSKDNSADKIMDASILNQVRKNSGIKLLVDTDTSLDDRRDALANVTPTSGLPIKASTQALTRRG